MLCSKCYKKSQKEKKFKEGAVLSIGEPIDEKAGGKKWNILSSVCQKRRKERKKHDKIFLY
jgi:hypothetical protein